MISNMLTQNEVTSNTILLMGTRTFELREERRLEGAYSDLVKGESDYVSDTRKISGVYTVSRRMGVIKRRRSVNNEKERRVVGMKPQGYILIMHNNR